MKLHDRLGWSGSSNPSPKPDALSRAVHDVTRPVFVVETAHGPAVVTDGKVSAGNQTTLLAAAGPIDPGALGSASFRRSYGLKAAYMAGAMAGGIASEDLVIALASAGYLASYGAAGVLPDRVAQAVERIKREVGDAEFAVNLIHSPSEAALEDHVVDVLVSQGITLIEASAFLEITAPLVRYRLCGATTDLSGRVVLPNRVIAKLSRPEVAELFLAPPPPAIVDALLRQGALTEQEARLAPQVRMADDITVEGDSGGHTDRRPLLPLLTRLLQMRERLPRSASRPRIGAAGGIGTPAAAAAAFAAGADYVVTGSVNQSCREAGTSDTARALLASADLADFVMAPAADMFELGVDLQVLRKGTMFPMRAGRLRDLYRNYDGLEALPPNDLAWLETILQAPVGEVWSQCEEYFTRRDPAQLERALQNPRRKMALVFRWYLGMASRWAVTGAPDRVADYQIWAGPALGAFNDWVSDTDLRDADRRAVAQVADVLMRGAAVATRQVALAAQGVTPVTVQANLLMSSAPKVPVR